MRPLKATLPLLLALLAPALPATALAAAPAGTGAEADSALFTADGYRQTRYRSPTPDTVEHAVTVDTPAVQALIAALGVFSVTHLLEGRTGQVTVVAMGLAMVMTGARHFRH